MKAPLTLWFTWLVVWNLLSFGIVVVASKRLVIFAGPHKSASSTVQELLVQYGTGRRRYRKVKAFQQWRWPLLQSSPIPARKQWAGLVTYNHNNHTEEEEEDRHQLQLAMQETYHQYPNVMVGSEEFDRFGQTPWSHRNGVQAIQEIQQWLPADDAELELVINYRTPRHAQWISIWKQLTSLDELRMGEPAVSYPDWICHDDRVWEYLDCVANPLGLANAFVQQNWTVSLIDMGGVTARDLDIAHVSACDVLQVPCTDGWVRGVNRTLLMNPKRRSLDDVSDRQLDEMEWLLRQRDCVYQTAWFGLDTNPNLSILYQDSLWKDCPANNSPSIANHQLWNTTYMVQLLQSQFDCHTTNNPPPPPLQVTLTQLVAMQAKAAPVDETITTSPASSSMDWIVVQLLQWIMVGVLFRGLFQFRRRRRKK
jgi:hypothetical protein